MATAVTPIALDVDMTNALKLRDKYKAAGQNVKLQAVIIKAIALALKKYPELNCTALAFKRVMYFNTIRCNLCVERDYKGEKVVFRAPLDKADEKTVPEISQFITEAQTKDLREVPEYRAHIFMMYVPTSLRLFCEFFLQFIPSFRALISHGFDYSSIGDFGIDSLSPPSQQTFIFLVGRMQKKPVVVDDEIVIRRMLFLNLTFDHRIMDGRAAATLLTTVKDILEKGDCK
jgi:pyruvate/2-oxoglutarate dehydrogenase complex dihydrolipoamide acyltransferase (E2) component